MEEISYGSMMYFMEKTGKTRKHQYIDLDWVNAAGSSRSIECEEVELFYFAPGPDGEPIPGEKSSTTFVLLPNGMVEKWSDPAKAKAVSYDSDF